MQRPFGGKCPRRLPVPPWHLLLPPTLPGVSRPSTTQRNSNIISITTNTTSSNSIHNNNNNNKMNNTDHLLHHHRIQTPNQVWMIWKAITWNHEPCRRKAFARHPPPPRDQLDTFIQPTPRNSRKIVGAYPIERTTTTTTERLNSPVALLQPAGVAPPNDPPVSTRQHDWHPNDPDPARPSVSTRDPVIPQWHREVKVQVGIAAATAASTTVSL
mmetsp:Transcript_8896/g.19205  ORF Transcript_8896/g.19205 Transcript_8896/m.19205 type:complete len:214 (-) Transcript_8896:329-970(-)